MLQGFLQGIKELIFPDNCFLCRTYLNSHHQKQLCPSCLSEISWNSPPFCLQCSRHLTAFNRQGLCPNCLKTTYAFDTAFSTCLYEGVLPVLIYAFKYYGKTLLKKTLGHWMIDSIETYHVPIEKFDMILPMPLHAARYRERGFNQAELLSSAIAQHYHLIHRTDILTRWRPTPSQTLQDAKQRWTNVSGAFRINHPLDIADKSILIVDDLLTTAATADAASNILKDSGAAYVGVLTLAITP